MSKFGPVGLLLIVTALLSMFTVPGSLGVVIRESGFSPQQTSVAFMITLRDCAGNPVRNAVIQLQSLRWGGWAYTGSNGVATLIGVPQGTYTLQSGYSTFTFSQTINLGTGGFTETVNLGSGCSTSTGLTQTQTFTPIKPPSPR